MAADRVAGYCPMGCGQSLVLVDGGHVVCSVAECPNRFAVDELLADTETEHVVLFGESGFTVRHPLAERLGDALLNCDLHLYIAGLDGPPVQLGRYRARRQAGRWAWEALSAAGGGHG